MPTSIQYGQLMHKALRRLMADVLTDVAENGLPGDHHFYIAFDTTHPGVDMAASLMERYPEEMTIVLQDWFEDLAVMTDRFSVSLNFGNVPQPIVVPFDAVKTFADPSVEFGLRFDGKYGDEDEQESSDGAGDHDAATQDASSGRDAEVVSLDNFRKH